MCQISRLFLSIGRTDTGKEGTGKTDMTKEGIVRMDMSKAGIRRMDMTNAGIGRMCFGIRRMSRILPMPMMIVAEITIV